MSGTMNVLAPVFFARAFVRSAAEASMLILNLKVEVPNESWSSGMGRGGVVGLDGSGGAGAVNVARRSCFLTLVSPNGRVVSTSSERRQGVRRRNDRGVNSDDGKTSGGGRALAFPS